MGLLELDPESRELCRTAPPAATAERGKVAAAARPGEPRPAGVLVPASRVRLRCGVAGLLVITQFVTASPAPAAAAMLGLLSLKEGGRGGGQSEPELGRSSLEPEENQDSRHDSQLEYCTCPRPPDTCPAPVSPAACSRVSRATCPGSRATDTQPCGSSGPSYQRPGGSARAGSAWRVILTLSPGLRSKLTSFSWKEMEDSDRLSGDAARGSWWPQEVWWCTITIAAPPPRSISRPGDRDLLRDLDLRPPPLLWAWLGAWLWLTVTVWWRGSRLALCTRRTVLLFCGPITSHYWGHVTWSRPITAHLEVVVLVVALLGLPAEAGLARLRAGGQGRAWQGHLVIVRLLAGLLQNATIVII